MICNKREHVSIGHNITIPLLLQGAIDKFVLVLLASKCDFNTVFVLFHYHIYQRIQKWRVLIFIVDHNFIFGL